MKGRQDLAQESQFLSYFESEEQMEIISVHDEWSDFPLRIPVPQSGYIEDKDTQQNHHVIDHCRQQTFPQGYQIWWS